MGLHLKSHRAAWLLVCAAAALQPGAAGAADPRFQIPSTVSPEAASQLKQVYSFAAAFAKTMHDSAPPKTTQEWQQRQQQGERTIVPIVQRMAEPIGVTSREETLGGVPVLRITPPGFVRSRFVLIYVHGGGYVGGSPKSTIVVPALIARAAGNEVISVDYTLAPEADWKAITDQVVSVYKAVLASGVDARSIGMFGESAGGSLVAGSVLKMRDKNLPLPGALTLLSPWSDITLKGDTYTTLAGADPTLRMEELATDAAVYAPPADQTNPYVSPIYGDFSKAFPPTLIQGGTRELFLSNCVRLYQAIAGGGHEAVLDIYEGMPHVFQALAPMAPETTTAATRAAAFFEHHLAKLPD